jgi:hypothetical protein
MGVFFGFSRMCKRNARFKKQNLSKNSRLVALRGGI